MGSWVIFSTNQSAASIPNLQVLKSRLSHTWTKCGFDIFVVLYVLKCCWLTYRYLFVSFTNILIYMLYITFCMKRKFKQWYSDSYQFHQYQQNEQSHLILTNLLEHIKTMILWHWKSRSWQVKKCSRVLNQLMGSQSSPLDNWFKSKLIWICISNSLLKIICIFFIVAQGSNKTKGDISNDFLDQPVNNME